MALKKYKPTSPGRRDMTGASFEEITRTAPTKSLLQSKRRHAGRNNSGRVTVRHRGGGHKRRYRLIDFRRDKHGVAARVASIEYTRTARRASPCWSTPTARSVTSSRRLAFRSATRSRAVPAPRSASATRSDQGYPVGSLVHNVELYPVAAGSLPAPPHVRPAARERGTYAQLRLPSGEVRRVHEDCMATLGQVGNTDHGNIKLGKAGRKRWLGWRPSVRGTAMDPNSHPHGGGEGRSPIGMPGPKTPWGKPARGMKTRHNKRTDQFIVRRRGKRRKG